MDKQYFAGEPLDRVDGRAKVTGAATYAAENNPEGITHGVLVTSTVTKGKIKSIDTRAAEKAPGVVAVVTHLNAPAVPGYQTSAAVGESRVEGQEFRVFYNEVIYFNNQPVALAIADTLERAQYAASLVKIVYEKEVHRTDLAAHLDRGYKPKRSDDYKRGTAAAYKAAPVTVNQQYTTPLQIHNPMETHAVVAVWQGSDKVTLYNKTQAPKVAQKDIMKAFALKEEAVHIVSPFVGGAFGGASRIWPEEMAAIIGAKKTGRPLKLSLPRELMFNMVGYRPLSVQQVALGTDKEGRLTGITYKAHGNTSTYEQFNERIIDPAKSSYACPNIDTEYKLVGLDMSTPCWTRGPGETSGAFALESAMDELAETLHMDPVALRIKNYTETDPENNRPWSGKNLKECYRRGAELFGWENRKPASGSTTEDGWLTGTGMSGGIYGAKRSPATVRIVLSDNGGLLLQSATADVGPGTATVMTGIAAGLMGLPPEKIRFELGDSSLPPAPGQFGSHTVASVGSAVHDVCKALQRNLYELAIAKENASFKAVAFEDMRFENGAMASAKDNGVKLSYTQILKEARLPLLELTKESKEAPEAKKYSSKVFCAHFVEVKVQAATGVVKVSKVVTAVDAGKIMNPKTARSQVYGSIVWGISMALMEEGLIDHHYGRYVNNNLADYHVAVNADIPTDIQIAFIDKEDTILDPIGAKGIGEIGLVGFAAAVSNAVYNATGKRIRDLPITPDKLI